MSSTSSASPADSSAGQVTTSPRAATLTGAADRGIELPVGADHHQRCPDGPIGLHRDDGVVPVELVADHPGRHAWLIGPGRDDQLFGPHQGNGRPRPGRGAPGAHRQRSERGGRHRALDSAGDQVGVTEEPGDAGIPWVGIEVLGAPGLADPAVTDDGDLFGQGESFVLIVGDEERGGALLPQHALDIGAHARTKAGVQGGEGLVEQDDARLDGQGAGQGHPLLLAAGQLMGIPAAQAAEADHLQELLEVPGPALLAGYAEGHVAQHVQVREERTLLGDVADASPLGGHEPATVVDHVLAEDDGPPVRSLETGQHPQQGGLATARRSEDGGQGALGDGEVDPGQDGVGPERLVEVGDVETGHDVPSARLGSRSNQRPST